MKYSKDHRIDQEVRRLLEAGWTVIVGGKHLKVKSPGGWVKAVPGTPSDHRSAENWRHEVRAITRRESSKSC